MRRRSLSPYFAARAKDLPMKKPERLTREAACFSGKQLGGVELHVGCPESGMLAS